MQQNTLAKAVVSQTLLKTWQQCNKKALFMLNGWKPTLPEWKMQWGTLMHAVMERFYRAIQAGVEFELAPVIAQLERELWQDPVYGHTSPWELELNLGLVELMAEEYIEYYYSEDAKRNWWAIERPFEATLGPIIQRGKPDIIEHAADGYWLWDTKTKGYYSPEQTKTLLPRDLQLMSYKRGIEQTAHIVIVGVVYNIIRQPQQRKKIAEPIKTFLERVRKDVHMNPADYFIRLRYKVTPRTGAIVEESLLALAAEYDNWWKRGTPAVENHQSCFMYGDKRCPFLEACYHGNYAMLMHGELFSELNDATTPGGKEQAEVKAK